MRDSGKESAVKRGAQRTKEYLVSEWVQGSCW